MTHSTNEPVVLEEEIEHVRVVTLNRPRQLNVISPEMISLLARYLENWENDPNVDLILISGSGRAFSSGDDLRVFYAVKKRKDSCLEMVYRMYWLCHHIHTYKKTMVALVNGSCMGGGASLMVPMTFSVVTDKTVFTTPETSIGFHLDCGFSYIHSRLPGYLGEFLGLTGSRLNGQELVAVGLATHYVPSEKLAELEKCLLSLNKGDKVEVKSLLDRFSSEVQIDADSILNRQSIINKCFSKNSVEEIIQTFEAEFYKAGNAWIAPVLERLKRSSPTGLKITLRSVREARNQTLAECLKREFRLTMNILRSIISDDIYEGIRALLIDKDNAPKWDPSSLDKVKSKNLDLVFRPFEAHLELQIPKIGEYRWHGRYEKTPYATSKL